MGSGPLTDEALAEAAQTVSSGYFFGQDPRSRQWGVFGLDGWGDDSLVFGAATKEEVADWLKAQVDEARQKAEQKLLDGLAKLREAEQAHQKVMRLLG